MMYHFIMSLPVECQQPKGGRSYEALGHEIHISRVCLLDLVAKKQISVSQIHVYTLPDRFFLYDSMFPHVSDVYQLGPLSPFPLLPTGHSAYHPTNDKDNVWFELYYMTYKSFSVTLPVFHHLKQWFDYDFHSSRWRTPDVLELHDRSIRYTTLQTRTTCLDSWNSWMVFHYRCVDSSPVATHEGDSHFQQYRELLKICAERFPRSLLVVFCHSSKSHVESLCDGLDPHQWVWTDNLQEYASFLHDSRCEKMFGEWSGGSQLAQYVAPPTTSLYYYFHQYPPWYCQDNMKQSLYQAANCPEAVIQDAWDFRCMSTIPMELFSNIDLLVEHIRTSPSIGT